jgi:polysaccharide chain length determinant protein (PEP-CTERM system associated)
MNRERRITSPLEQIRQYWHLVRQNTWTIYFATLLLTAAGAVGIALLPNSYRATTTILVDPQKVPDEYVTSVIKSPLTERLQTISQEVLSVTRLQSVIDHWHLYADLRRSMTSDQIIEYMRNNIQIDVKHASGLGPATFSITYEGRDPQVTAEVANELAQRFIEWNVSSREEQADNTARFLGAQLGEAQGELARQEARVRQFKMDHLGEMPDQAPSNLAALAQLRVSLSAANDSLNRLEQERIELQRMPQVVQGSVVRSAPTTERSRLEDEKLKLEGQLFELRRRYTASHPDVIEAQNRLDRVAQQLKALPPDPDPAAEAKAETSAQTSAAAVRLEIIGREMQRLEGEQKRIQAQIAAYQDKLDAVPLREQQLADLTRGYDTAREEYHSLLSKKYAADMAANLERRQEGERFTVLDPAVKPERPFKPNRKVLMCAAFLAALAAAVGLVLVKDFFDSTIKAEEHVRSLLPASVSIMAAIPTILARSDYARRRRMAIFAVLSTIVTISAVGVFYWKVHPIL